MKLLHRLRRLAALALAAAFVCVFAPAAFAIDPIDTQMPASLTLQYSDGAVPLEGVEFRLYKVGDTDEWANFTPTADFAAYPVELKAEDAAEWNTVAQTLSGYAARDGVEPLAAAKTTALGQVAFAPLTPGLYLVVADNLTIDRTVYSCAPFLITLPARAADESQCYDVTASPKVSTTPAELTAVSVVKVWDDQAYNGNRPAAVSVQLLKDGKIVDTVTLSPSNNWRHTWSELVAGPKYEVVENYRDSNYKVRIILEKGTYVVCNSYVGPVPTPTPQPSQPGGGQSLHPTGQLWWPVPVLLVAGLGFVLCGLVRKRDRE